MFRYVQRASGLATKTSFRSQFLSNLSKKEVEVPKGISVSMKAYYIASRLNFLSLFRVPDLMYQPMKQEFQPKSMKITIDSTQNQYVVIFKYGSVVFFNIPEDQHAAHLSQIGQVADGPVFVSEQHNESYKIILSENLERPSMIKNDHVNIRALDNNNITILSTILAQTVALDYHAVAAGKLLDRFNAMNASVRETGGFGNLTAKELHKLIASNNNIISNVISEMGIFEGTDAAWENADYTTTWEGVRRDFEVDQRFKDLSLKLDFIKEDSRFFLEVMHNQNASKLEWIIIILIATEIVIGLAGLGINYLPK